MKWYDIFSNFYDRSLERLYYSSRKRAVELLDLKDNQTVLDIACGTGANFKHILASNNNIILYGTDYSAGMLEKSKKLIARNAWKNTFLFQADAREINISNMEIHIKNKIKFDRIICVLGLSVIPEWENVLENLIGLLEENGKIVIVDVFAEKEILTPG